MNWRDMRRSLARLKSLPSIISLIVLEATAVMKPRSPVPCRPAVRRWPSSIHARLGTSPRRWGSSPRPMPSTPACWLDFAELLAQREDLHRVIKPLADEQLKALQVQLLRPRQLRAMLTAEQQRPSLSHVSIREDIEASIRFLKERLDKADGEPARLIERNHAALVRC